MAGEVRKPTNYAFRYVAVILIALLAVLIVFLVTAPQKGPGNQETEATEDPNLMPTASAMDTLKINALIGEYYGAKMNADAEKLNEIVVGNTRFNTADLLQEINIISRYDNYRIYVIPSPADSYYAVYVTYDIFFQGLSVGAPALNHFVVRKQAEDTFKIYDRYVSEDFEKWLTETENTELIKNLREQVDNDLKAACASDQDLKELMDFLENSTNETKAPEESTAPETTAAPGPDDTGETTGEEETAKNAETEPETDEHN